MVNNQQVKEVFVTTFDNPFDYFKQFDDWYNYDHLMGYNTLEYLARLVKTAPDLSEEEEQLEIERAIDSMIEWNGAFYKKVFKT